MSACIANLATDALQAMEPFFSVLLSWLFLGEAASAPVLLSLLPIVGGVAAASVSEVQLSCACICMRRPCRHQGYSTSAPVY